MGAAAAGLGGLRSRRGRGLDPLAHHVRPPRLALALGLQVLQVGVELAGLEPGAFQLREAGVNPTAWGGNQPPVNNPVNGEPGSTPTDLATLNPTQCMKMGLKKFKEKAA